MIPISRRRSSCLLVAGRFRDAGRGGYISIFAIGVTGGFPLPVIRKSVRMTRRPGKPRPAPVSG
jgi:hypothetical protein